MDGPASRELTDLRITGTVEIRPAPYYQYEPIEVIFSAAATASWQEDLPSFAISQGELRVMYPRPSPEVSQGPSLHDGLKRNLRRGSEHTCLSVWARINVRTPLENFDTHTDNLHIDLGVPRSYPKSRPFPLLVYHSTNITSRKGNITIDRLHSRRANVRSDEGSILGKFQLHDELVLETGAGEIRADVQHIPARESGYLESHPPNTPANFTTRTQLSHQQIFLLQGLNGLLWAQHSGYGYPYLLNSAHHSSSGSIDFGSWDFWEGSIFARSFNGSVELQDDSWEVLPDPSHGISVGDRSSQIRAKRGSQHSNMILSTTDGDIDVCIGEMINCYSRQWVQW